MAVLSRVGHMRCANTSTGFFGFATDDKEQYEELRKVHGYIVFTDREKVPSIPRIEGTHKLHSVAGNPSSRKLSADGTATFKLTTRACPCECFVCRKIITDRECSFKHTTKEQILPVSEEVKGATRKRVDRTPEETELMRQLEELVCTKLGLEKLTVKNMQSACRQRIIPHTGKKLKMVKRLDLFFNSLEANPTAALLVTDYIRDDQDLSDSDEEDGNDEDPKESPVS
jgi:hypothetical protein